jgi:hypothetical protein
MRFYQHIYGRVASGYQSGYSGYQVAALTDSLANRQELLQKLNRCSFFHRYEGEGNKERYSFYRPAPGLLAFGCSRLVRDATGAIGSFAHNFVCEESDFLQAEVTPVALLTSLPFVKTEVEIGDNRSLPVYELGETAAAPGAPEWRPLALSLADTYLGESVLVIPMVVLGEAETWSLLAELFSHLPRLEAARLSFSTLFKDATDYIEEFRLVFVPDQKTVPRDAQIYRVLEPGPDGTVPVKPPAVPLTAFLRAAPAEGASLIRLINLLRRAAARSELMDAATQFLPGLLSYGRLFREAVESMRVTNLYSLLVRDTDWLATYGRAGNGLEIEAVCAAVWETPSAAPTRMTNALGAAQQLQQWQLSTALFEDLARRVAADKEAMALVRQLERQGQLNGFCEDVARSAALAEHEQESVAERLRNEGYYAGQIHQAIARRLLSMLSEGRREGARRAGRWLSREAEYLNDQFLQAVADLWEWDGAPAKLGRDFRLANYQLADAEQYHDLLPAAWLLSRPYNWGHRLAITYHPVYRNAFFVFCASRLKRFDLYGQKQLLRALAEMSRPYGRENQILIDGIRDVERPYELAQYYAEVLDGLPVVDAEAIRQLQSLQPPKSLWDRFRW